MWSTLIIMEVIPFLILAVGVDNLCAQTLILYLDSIPGLRIQDLWFNP